LSDPYLGLCGRFAALRGVVTAVPRRSQRRCAILLGQHESLVEAVDQGLSIDRLAQETYRSGLHCPRAHGVIIEGRYENERYAAILGKQQDLQLDAAQARHLNVGDHTFRIVYVWRAKKIIGASKRAGFVSERPHEILQGAANR
jgi:hypothetical protein